MNNLKGFEGLSEEKFQQLLRIPIHELDKHLAERSLKEFVSQAWHVVEPKNEFLSNWHIEAICEHLEAVSKGQIKKLIINIPPRSLKSLTVCVFWPAWEWTWNPSCRWIFASYSERLSSRDSRKCRYVITSPWYQRNWGDRFRLFKDQNAKLRYDNDKMGYRIATSVAGVGTGEGGDRFVCFPYDTMVNIGRVVSNGEWEENKMMIGEIVERYYKHKVKGIPSIFAQCYDHNTETLDYKKIRNLFKIPFTDKYLIEIEMEDRSTLNCTENHPIWVKGKGYVNACELEENNEILSLEKLTSWKEMWKYGGKEKTIIKKIKKIRRIRDSRVQYVYNMDVEDNHNYFANNILVHNCDDPHSVLEALSDTKRVHAIDWFDQAVTTRGDNPDSAKVVIMQRLNEGDLSGHLLAKDAGYEHLCLPMEYEGMNRCKTSLNFIDPRTEPNEILHKTRYNRKQIDELKKDMTPYAVAGQLQQRPVPLEGGMIQWNWFKRYTDLPGKDIYLETVQVWDTAQKDNELLNCPWVCGTWMIFYDGYYLVDILRKWMNYPDGKKQMFQLADRYKPNAVLIEDKSTGQSLIQEMSTYESEGKKWLWPIIPFEPEGSKETRMYVEAPQIHAGKVFLPIEAHWLADFESEVKSFPNSTFKDQIDMLSMFLRYMKMRMEMIGSRPMAWGNKPVENDNLDIPLGQIEDIHIPMGPNTRDSARMDF